MRPVCDISVIVPAYREGASLLTAVGRIAECTRQATCSFELILVDDGSDDSTWNSISKLSSDHAEVRGIRLSRNYGKDAAISAGIADSAGRAVLVIDADLQHPPDLIPEFYKLWAEGGYDIVEGVKRDRGKEGFLRRQFSRLFNSAARASTGLDLRNSTDFKLMSREVVEAWRSMNESRLFFRGMVEWLGFRKIHVPFDVAESLRRTSNWSPVQLISLSLRAIISYSSVPLRIPHIVAAAFTFFGIVLGVETLYMWFSRRAVDGFTTVIVLLLLLGGLILGVLAIISEYIAAIYEEVKARPRFVVSELTGPKAASRTGGSPGAV